VTRFIAHRLFVTIPVLFGLVFLVFVLARVVPGDPCRAVLGERATDAVCDAFIVRYGLDQPIPVQFGIYLGQLAQGDLGVSIKHSRPVTQLLIERLPTTVELTFWALLFAIVVGIPLGIASAIRRNSPVDVGAMVVANLGVSMPVFVLGLFLQFIFALLLKNTPLSLPASGRLSAGIDVVPLVQVWGLQGTTGVVRGILDFFSGIYTISALITGQWAAWFDAVRHLILPAIALGTIPLAIIARITRSSLLETLGQDYVRTARAKGLKER
jgi:peptide/nickel transport system permease protein